MSKKYIIDRIIKLLEQIDDVTYLRRICAILQHKLGE